MRFENPILRQQPADEGEKDQCCSHRQDRPIPADAQRSAGVAKDPIKDV